MQDRAGWDLKLVLLGVLCLVVSSVCDNLRGPVLPLLAQRYSLGYARAGMFLVSGSFASFLFNSASVHLLEALSDKGYLLAALGLQTGAMAGLAWGGGFPWLLLCGMSWGAGNSGLGLAANLFVIRGSPESGRGRGLSLLHSFYGLSSCLPAFYVARALHGGMTFAPLVLLPTALPAALALYSLGLRGETAGPADPGAQAHGLSAGAWTLCSCIALYVMGEALTSMWLVAYLHGRWALPLEKASGVLAAFFLALGAGRVVTGLWTRPGLERILPPLSLLAGASGLAAGLGGARWGFVAAALALGPFFPLMVARLSVEYPSSYRRLISAVYALMTVGLAGGHFLIGKVADAVSLQAACCFPPACLAASLGLLLLRRKP